MKQINPLIIQAAKKKIIYTQHAIDEMNSEDEMITVDEIISVIYHGEIIEDYSKDFLFPSCLIYGRDRKVNS